MSAITIEDAALLAVEAGVRYWEDADVNGVTDEDGSLIPLRSGDLWKPRIVLVSGRIVDWPKGATADIHYKVCDAGEYWLTDANGKRLFKWKGHYVPDSLLCVGDRGYGDYIILSVSEDGFIEGWTTPVLDQDDWEATP